MISIQILIHACSLETGLQRLLINPHLFIYLNFGNHPVTYLFLYCLYFEYISERLKRFLLNLIAKVIIPLIDQCIFISMNFVRIIYRTLLKNLTKFKSIRYIQCYVNGILERSVLVNLIISLLINVSSVLKTYFHEFYGKTIDIPSIFQSFENTKSYISCRSKQRTRMSNMRNCLSFLCLIKK